MQREQLKEENLSSRDTVMKSVEEVADRYIRHGRDLVEAHKLFQPMTAERVKEIVLRAEGYTKNAVRVQRNTLERDEKKSIMQVQLLLSKLEEETREAMTFKILKKLFGVDFGHQTISLWIGTNVLGIMRVQTFPILAIEVLEKEIEKLKEKEKMKVVPSSYAGDVNQLQTQLLQQIPLTTIIKFPARWKDFVVSSPAKEANKRELMKALEMHFKMTVKRRASTVKGLLPEIYEIEEILQDVADYVTPRPSEVSESKYYEEKENTFILRKAERLHTIRLRLWFCGRILQESQSDPTEQEKIIQ